MVFLDAGYLKGENPSDLVWVQEVEFDAICASDFTMRLYRNDVLYYTKLVSVSSPGVRDVHRIPVPRESKGERLRLTFASSTDEGAGDVGFDPYMVRCRVRSTGNEDMDRQYQTVYPAGEAP